MGAGRVRRLFPDPAAMLTWKTAMKGKGLDSARYITALLPQPPAAQRGEQDKHAHTRDVASGVSYCSVVMSRLVSLSYQD